jgi:assimilatory nitrate reductase catalytic subunit
MATFPSNSPESVYFARVALETSQIDYNGRFCMSSAAAASSKALGLDRGLPFPMADIPYAQTALLIGSNTAESMPPFMQYFEALAKNGGSLIVVDPRQHLYAFE